MLESMFLNLSLIAEEPKKKNTIFRKATSPIEKLQFAWDKENTRFVYIIISENNIKNLLQSYNHQS